MVITIETKLDGGGGDFLAVVLPPKGGWSLPSWKSQLTAITILTTSILLALRPSHHSPPCTIPALAPLLPPSHQATIEAATPVPAGSSHGEGPANTPYPWIPTSLPPLCALTIRVSSSPTSSYRLGLYLPHPSLWKRRLLTVGNGGFAGGINWIDMAPGPHYGMASLSTDTGHNSSSTETSWANANPEAKQDWGWRALHGSVVVGRHLVERYYSHKIRYSYFSGCSTGGRQGLRETMEFPGSFDGVLVGAPAWWASRVYNWRVGWAG
ncbi:hypothetical protein OQA88_1277 [Cercophora sp. LCS_1]